MEDPIRNFEIQRENDAVGLGSEICLDCQEFPCICGEWTDEAKDLEIDAEYENEP